MCCGPRGVINEVADEKGCSSVLFFEARKRQDLYLWMVRQAAPQVQSGAGYIKDYSSKPASNCMDTSTSVISGCMHRL